METADSSSAELPRMAVRLPPFWPDRPAMWVAQAEAQFTLAVITSERIKFCHVIAHLDAVEDIITSPPERGPYTLLRTELVRRLFSSPEQRSGNFSRSKKLRYLKSLAPDVSDNVIRNVWTSRLPRNVKSFLAGQKEGNLEAAALCAGRISEVEVQSALVSVDEPTDIDALRQEIAELSRQVAALNTEQDHLHPRFRKSPSRGDTTFSICGYNRRFIARAQNCTPPCSYRQTQRTSSAAHVCATITGRLFITDLVHRCMEPTNYDLCAANGTTIHTYGWLPLSLNLGLRREFTWRFVVADVSHPIIGVDFLSHFGPLVDCRNNPILDVQREIRHNTVQHIRTVPSPPVTCRPRRLAPERLAITKAEFDAMLRDGKARRSKSSWASALTLYPASSAAFSIFTDHKPITYAFQQKRDKCSPRQFNHLDFIAQFTTDIRHISGQDNVFADALSRFKSVTAPPSYDTLAASQVSDDELQSLWQSNTVCGSKSYQSSVPRCPSTAIPVPGHLGRTSQLLYGSKCPSPSMI
ncbi:hypothetical protein B7P43_G17346 [Cryptotermes secundus]|uniref:DUF7041 domain-containing protein n=1 Tax=Cryptotermes secundus TaxID=105785 RepID=A0A2J7QCT3_9NEOP|nr:hypothetical protein B7P43_G17346 [Cryptotermes secundus]